MSKIDFVIPWVDGADEKWLAEKAKYIPGADTDSRVNRYRDWDMLRFWFRGVEKFAPWVNRIHFITWGHLPEWLNTENEKLSIVNHKDYIPEKYLPVFSANPIELNMHRIESLSEQFVYFNDDMFLTDFVSEEDFFVNDLPCDTMIEVPLRFHAGGIDHIIGNDMAVINRNFSKKEAVKRNKKQWFSLTAPTAALKNLYMLPVESFSAFDNPHIPIPYLKSTLSEVWEKEGAVLDATSSHRFRSNEDVNQWLFRYWQFAKGSFVQKKPGAGRFFSIGPDDGAIADAVKNHSYKMVCLSDDNPDMDFEGEKKKMKEIFEPFLSEKSSFEK